MVNPDLNLIVIAESQQARTLRTAQELAERLNVHWHGMNIGQAQGTGIPSSADFILSVNDERLELRDPATKPGRGLSVDFSTLHPKQAARRRGFSRKQPLARAVGKATHTVIDCTAGLGHDAALLACMGYCVIAVERSPIVAALLEDGLRRAVLDEELRTALGGRLIVAQADAREVLESIATDTPSSIVSHIKQGLGDQHTQQLGQCAIDCCYIDPMFPPKRKASALAKKSIRMVRAMVGDDEDAAELIATGRKHIRRVVVKRPTHAPPLADNPTMSIESKLVRYDIYLK